MGWTVSVATPLRVGQYSFIRGYWDCSSFILPTKPDDIVRYKPNMLNKAMVFFHRISCPVSPLLVDD